MKSVAATSMFGPISLSLLVLVLQGTAQTKQHAASAFESMPSSRWTVWPFHASNISSRNIRDTSSIQPKPRTSSPFGFHTTMVLHSNPNRNRNLDSDNTSSNDDNDDDDDEVFAPSIPTRNEKEENPTVSTTSSSSKNKNKNKKYLDDLTPPPVNFARNSILFSENPSTKLRNNPPLAVWKFSRTYLPAVLTGAWPWRDINELDERPLAALYNALLVRLPVLVVTVSYLYQKIAEGHDLVIDLGFDSSGPQAVPPILVVTVLVLILL